MQHLRMLQELNDMKVVFWGPVRGHGSITNSTLLFSLYMSKVQKKQTSVLSTNHYSRTLQQAFMSEKDELEFLKVINSFGLNALFREAKSGYLSEDVASKAALTVCKGYNIYPVPKQGSPLTETILEETYDTIIETLDRINNFVFVDTRGGATKLNQLILQSADIIVLCIDQSRSVIEELLLRCNISNKKIVLLLGDYDANSNYTIKNVKRSIGALQTVHSIVVPHNIDFANAINLGTLDTWMTLNQSCGYDDLNYPIIMQAKSFTDYLIEQSNKEVK